MAKTVKPKQRSTLKPTKKKMHTRTQCLQLAQKLCKLRELNEYGRLWCISCGQPLQLGDARTQGGHYISRADRATETEPDNLWPQCSSCNVLKAGNIPMFRYNLVKLIGSVRVERLEYMSLARRGDAEALALLSPADRLIATQKKSARYYDSLYYELKAEIKRIEEELDGQTD